jgi:hypothetical protein
MMTSDERDDDDEDFELEMSWVCEESDRKHQRVPQLSLDSNKQLKKLLCIERWPW